MNINLTMLGQLISFSFLLLIPVGFAFGAYLLAKTRDPRPKVAAIVGFFFGIIPVLGLIYIIVLASKPKLDALEGH